MTDRFNQTVIFGKSTGDIAQAHITPGESVPLATTPQGALYVTSIASGGVTSVTDPGDGRITTALTMGDSASLNYLTNGTTIDRERGNTADVMLATSARNNNTLSPTTINYNARGGHFIINVSQMSGAPSITPKIMALDSASSAWYPLLIATPITAIGVTVLKIYPGITPTPNLSASDILPRSFRVELEHLNTDSITYSVGMFLVL